MNTRQTPNPSRRQEYEQVEPRGLGTFAGVFTPSILTILGIILFLRLGYVTGAAGVGRALFIVGLANLITLLTSQSLAAIATNLKVKGGGDYYLISRTLGIEYGGAIGIVLFLAQSVSVAFYCIGFAEAATALIGTSGPSATIVALLAMLSLFFLAWLGADWATRFQYLVMALLVAALFSFVAGTLHQWQTATFLTNWTPGGQQPEPFWLIFGVFFPAVTGFTQGVSMSGDLKDPGKSLPLGTFCAVGVSIAVYVAVMVLFAGVLPNQLLIDDYQAMQRVSRYGGLIDAGVIAATLSSAMASFLGGPRILQSLAADKVFPPLTPFAKGAGTTNNPRRAILLTAIIATATILVGQLNLVARVVSMFFLISYGLLNYATWYEAYSDSPSFRPRFRWFNKYLSLLGCLICGGVILALDLEYGLAAGGILIAIHQYIKRRNTPARWADSGRSHAMQVIRRQLQSTQGDIAHDRDWRPHLIAFTKDPERRQLLLHYAEWLAGNSGLVSAVKITEGHDRIGQKLRQEATLELDQAVRENGTMIFPLAVTGADLTTTLEIFLQSYGIGPLRANTVLCNWYGENKSGFPGLSALKFAHNLRLIYRLGFNLLILHADPLRTERLLEAGRERTIDIWFRKDATGRLMLLLGYLMTRSPLWSESEIRVLYTGSDSAHKQDHDNIEQLLTDARIPATPLAIGEMTPETIIHHSADATQVFLPFRFRDGRLADLNGYSLERVLTRLPPALMVMAAKDIDLDAEPEEGVVGLMGQALDALQAAERRAEKSQRELAQITRRREQLQVKRDDAPGSEQINNELSRQIEELTMEEKEVFRRAAKDQARLENALNQVENLGRTR